MNRAEKIVFSRTLQKANWNNTTLLKENVADQMRRMKQTPGKDMTLLGSGSVLTQFADEGLIDEYQIMVDPLLLGAGTPIGKGLRQRRNLRLMMTKSFRSGSVLLCYQPC